jgi:hypothetical protein
MLFSTVPPESTTTETSLEVMTRPLLVTPEEMVVVIGWSLSRTALAAMPHTEATPQIELM